MATTAAPAPSAAPSSATAGRSYNDAIDALNSLQTPFAVIEARRKAGIRPDQTSIAEMLVYLRRIGYTPSDLDRLNVVHVAGTKGKGSTCAFVANILARHQQQSPRALPRRVGLFTSPHLIAVRERIRIDGRPIDEERFARYFFEVWDRLAAAEEREGPAFARPATTSADADDVANALPMPPRPIYARYLTLMSYHVYLSEGVDAAVYETGIGGEYDATNIVPRPAATGISTLGIDHVFALGDNVASIAWHKAGIMKPGSPAFTIEQVPEAAEVLRRRAVEKNDEGKGEVNLRVLPVDPRLATVRVQPDALFQRRNASLAVALAEAALRRIDPEAFPGENQDSSSEVLAPAFVEGIEQVVWRGRCEVKRDRDVASSRGGGGGGGGDGATGSNVVWYIDGAHTVDSLKMASRWFADECASAAAHEGTPAKVPAQRDLRVLIFNQQGRDEAVNFLEGIHSALLGRKRSDAGIGGDEAATGSPSSTHQQPAFDRVIFCSNVTYSSAGGDRSSSGGADGGSYKRDFVNHQYDPEAVRALTAQHAFAARWRELDAGADVRVLPTIEDAIRSARELGETAAAGGGGVAEGAGPPPAVRAFITGSLHLVGGALGILEEADAL